MSRVEGFDVMDVSTALPNDPKFRRLAREHPDVLGTAFFAYVATMAESWKAGERVSVETAWPPILPHDDSAVTALLAVKLLDPKRRVTASAWRGFFEQARIRREKSRERWRRANEARAQRPGDLNGNDSAGTSRLPRGANAVTAPPSDSVRPSESVDTTPPTPSPARGRNGRAKKPAGDPPGMTGNQTDYDALMKSDDDLPDDEATNPWQDGNR